MFSYLSFIREKLTKFIRPRSFLSWFFSFREHDVRRACDCTCTWLHKWRCETEHKPKCTAVGIDINSYIIQFILLTYWLNNRQNLECARSRCCQTVSHPACFVCFLLCVSKWLDSFPEFTCSMWLRSLPWRNRTLLMNTNTALVFSFNATQYSTDTW